MFYNIIMENMDVYQKGMTVYGKITGIKPYGAFVGFENGVSGLVHISELSNGYVKDITKFVNVGDYCLLKIIDIDLEHKQLRLSFKALADNNRKYIKRVKFQGMPENKLGFSSISAKMPEWLGDKYD